MFEALDPTERANKAALLLVHERYNAQFAPFVKGQAARLSYVSGQIDDMIDDVTALADADTEWVKEKFTAFLVEAVSSGLEDIKETDVMARGEVEGAGIEEALKPDNLKREDLGTFSVTGKRLSKKQIAALKQGIDFTGDEMAEMYPDGPDEDEVSALNHMWEKDMGEQVDALYQQLEVTDDPDERDEIFRQIGELQYKINKPAGPGHSVYDEEDMSPDEAEWSERGMRGGSTKKGDANWNDDGQEHGIGTGATDAEPAPQMFENGGQMMCVLCERIGKETVGNMEDLQFHVQNEHADEVARAEAAPGRPDAEPLQEARANVKEAEVPRTDEDAPRAEPMPQNPGDEFDSYVQHLAESAAARKFSLPDEQQIHSIASQIGAPPEDVKNNLVAVAIFGDVTARNGEVGDETGQPDGYEEVSAQGVGGRIDATEAMVPTDLVISKVAEKMNMEQDLAYSMIRDRYGADLPEKYHASVTGEVHLYLPSAMAGNQTQQTDPSVGPTPQPASPVPPAQQPTL